jgi:hypothetical protein
VPACGRRGRWSELRSPLHAAASCCAAAGPRSRSLVTRASLAVCSARVFGRQ